jgi:hypothetical protein
MIVEDEWFATGISARFAEFGACTSPRQLWGEVLVGYSIASTIVTVVLGCASFHLTVTHAISDNRGWS